MTYPYPLGIYDRFVEAITTPLSETDLPWYSDPDYDRTGQLINEEPNPQDEYDADAAYSPFGEEQ